MNYHRFDFIFGIRIQFIIRLSLIFFGERSRSSIGLQEYLAQIQQHRELGTCNDVCAVLDAAAALPGPPSTAWRVTFLGTGGALPSKHRNVSAILLSYKCDIPPHFAPEKLSFNTLHPLIPSRTTSGDAVLTGMRHILLDCGEGTTFQLVRLVGPAQASAIIAALDFVWLSHAHADHHLGLLEVAREFFHNTGHSLKVFAPTKLHTVIRRTCDPGVEEAEAAVSWLSLLSAWEGVPMQVTSCSDLAAKSTGDASGGSVSATAIRQHVPNCELLGVTAARVAHRLEQVVF